MLETPLLRKHGWRQHLECNSYDFNTYIRITESFAYPSESKMTDLPCAFVYLRSAPTPSEHIAHKKKRVFYMYHNQQRITLNGRSDRADSMRSLIRRLE